MIEHDLALVCAAAARLVGCISWEDSAAGMLDVLVNLVGCDDVAIYAQPSGGGPAQRVLSVGPRAAEHPTLATAASALRIPFEIGDIALGALAVFRLVPHKTGFDRLDRELLELVARHAAAVLWHAHRTAVRR